MTSNFFFSGLLAIAAGAASLLSANTAEALQLSQEQWEEFNQYVQDESVKYDANKLKAIDVQTMRWTGRAEGIEVYFINEGACYQNQLLYSADSDALATIFENVSSSDAGVENACSGGSLTLGEGISIDMSAYLGKFQQGQDIIVDFFLNSNAYGQENLNVVGMTPNEAYASDAGSNLLGADENQNPDNLQHMIAYEIGEWTLLGFEDIIGGGDLDYNDTVFVVKGITGDLAEAPEPMAGLAFGLLATAGVMTRRKRK